MTMQKKYIWMFLLLPSILFVSLSHAEDFEIKVKQLEKNLFKLEGKTIFVHTQDCETMKQDQDPYLSISEASKTIRFRKAEGKCEVKRAYKLSGKGKGSYSVIIRREENDWYGIASTDSFIRTKGCASLAQGQKAILSLNGTNGTLIIAKLECQIEGVYTKIE
ncbi:MAG: hypothetical protein GXO96_01250 [Nitrospirae bacterium]|nr:hypothetical protein [Candidatus Manganitrophaceae bacterium]